ncbi:SAM-dependent methyltransferase [Nocardia ignorata]|uniref:S-adenosyl methyltransferase n=1 Tax=Nocardia ignorata TaxID=145285 RepID=A0A4R6NY52_NOCIG|nr:SAM-dependent methyltransferase [Nocardia ignorata]TDP28230.1 S-adenosyl methyltransferase [Nocardia ignorata]
MTNQTRLDTSRANAARVGNVLLGGKDAYDLDLRVAEPLLDSQFAVALVESRRFARRAVEHLSNEHQVRQVVELGCGFPLPPDIGAIAARANRAARTLYIDNDLLAVTHAHALLREPQTFVAKADLTDTAAVLTQITTVMDTTAPLAVCLSGTAELLADAPVVLESLTRELPPDSWIILSHITNEPFWHDVGRAVEVLGSAGIAYHPRDRDTITAMLAPYRLIDPELIEPHRWRPADTIHDALRSLRPEPWGLSAYAAVGQLRA